jgi:hypothetical protein
MGKAAPARGPGPAQGGPEPPVSAARSGPALTNGPYTGYEYRDR